VRKKAGNGGTKIRSDTTWFQTARPRKPAPNDGSPDGLRKKPNSRRKVDLGRWKVSEGAERRPKPGKDQLRLGIGRLDSQESKRRKPAIEWPSDRRLSQESRWTGGRPRSGRVVLTPQGARKNAEIGFGQSKRPVLQRTKTKAIVGHRMRAKRGLSQDREAVLST
jgi:hypothetical protein